MAAAPPPWSTQPVPDYTPLGPAPDAGPSCTATLREHAAAFRASLDEDHQVETRRLPASGPAGLPPPPQPRRPGSPVAWPHPTDRLAAIAHELRTPLTSIMAMLATVEQRGAQLGLGQVIDYARTGLQQARRLENMIDQLLEGAEQRPPADGGGPAGREPAERELVDAAELARQAGHVATLTYPGRPIAVDARGPLSVRVEPDQVLEVLDNLLGNADKYTPAGTPIWLEARRESGAAVLAVEDAGPGVPPEQRERIFEQFTRLDGDAAQVARGLGLGLTIARQLARAQGGDLVAVDPRRPGGGARFELHLPLAPRAPWPRR